MTFNARQFQKLLRAKLVFLCSKCILTDDYYHHEVEDEIHPSFSMISLSLKNLITEPVFTLSRFGNQSGGLLRHNLRLRTKLLLWRVFLSLRLFSGKATFCPQSFWDPLWVSIMCFKIFPTKTDFFGFFDSHDTQQLKNKKYVISHHLRPSSSKKLLILELTLIIIIFFIFLKTSYFYDSL